MDASSSDGDVVHYVININLIDPLFSILPLFPRRRKSETQRSPRRKAPASFFHRSFRRYVERGGVNRKTWRGKEFCVQVALYRVGHLCRCSDSLRAGRSRDRVPVEARFSATVQTGPGAHPVSCTMGTASFPGVKRPGRGVDHALHLTPRLRKE